jgi:hypothetical protein
MQLHELAWTSFGVASYHASIKEVKLWRFPHPPEADLYDIEAGGADYRDLEPIEAQAVLYHYLNENKLPAETTL